MIGKGSQDGKEERKITQRGKGKENRSSTNYNWGVIKYISKGRVGGLKSKRKNCRKWGEGTFLKETPAGKKEK